MSMLTSQFQRHLRRFAAIGLLGALYLLARLPEAPEAEWDRLGGRFQFQRAVIPVVPGPDVRGVRPVHPSLRHISAWISSVGAAVALNDLDDDGLPNDLCYVDVRSDQVIVAPIPGTGARYKPFALDAGPLFSRATMAPMGCLPGDLDEDGRMDLLVYYWGRPPVVFLRRGGALGAAGYLAYDLIPGGQRWYTNAATFADLDGDGHSDLIIGNYFADGARILDAEAGGAEQMQHSMSRALNAGRNRILLWEPAGPDPVAYREVRNALTDEVAHGWTLAAGAADLDGDLLPEIYFANDFGPDRLLHNRSTPGSLRFELLHGRRTFNTPASKVLGHDSFKGMGVDFGDLNGDGWPDFFVSNIAQIYALEESHFAWLSTGKVDQMRQGVAPYADRGEDLGLSRSGWGWDTRIADFDGDGVPEVLQAVGFLRGTVNRWPELHEVAMGNDELLSSPSAWHHFQPGDDLSGGLHNPFYVRASDGRYYDAAPRIGLDQSQISRGISVADVDGDGRLDFAVANQWEDSWFYRNLSPASSCFLGVRIRRGKVPAIGATARVELPGGREMTGQVDGGSGHSGKRSPELYFGLGAMPPKRSIPVEVRWRDSAGVHSRRYQLRPGWNTIDLQGTL
jgi:hypothetical protein